MSYELKVLNEAVLAHPSFEDNISSARTLKWLFAVLMPLINCYTLTGREHLIAEGLIKYYDVKSEQGTKEWECYLSSGRTGRMDTDDVKICLSQLSGYILNVSNIEPIDSSRYFTQKQRKEIWDNSGKECAKCGIHLTPTNFHADHIKPHSEGGPTTVDNGQVLCSLCNLSKGKDTIVGRVE
jgi:hypothetical protein